VVEAARTESGVTDYRHLRCVKPKHWRVSSSKNAPKHPWMLVFHFHSMGQMSHYWPPQVSAA
jgi:hypothetical protein